MATDPLTWRSRVVSIPEEFIPLVIGKKAKNILQIQMETGCRVYFSEFLGETREIYIRGEAEKTTPATAMLKKIIDEIVLQNEAKMQAVKDCLKKVTADPMSFDGTELDMFGDLDFDLARPLAEYDKHPARVDLDFSVFVHKYLNGKGGSLIRQVASETNCKIEFAPFESDASTRRCFIEGRRRDVCMAYEKFRVIIEKKKGADYCTTGIVLVDFQLVPPQEPEECEPIAPNETKLQQTEKVEIAIDDNVRRVETIKLPEEYIPLVIGEKAKNVLQVQEEANCLMYFGFSEKGMRDCHFYGTRKEVDQGVAMIQEKMNLLQNKDNVKSQTWKICLDKLLNDPRTLTVKEINFFTESSLRGTDAFDMHHARAEIELSALAVKLVIGKKTTTITKITKETECHIHFVYAELGTPIRRGVIIGRRYQVCECFEQMRLAIQKKKGKEYSLQNLSFISVRLELPTEAKPVPRKLTKRNLKAFCSVAPEREQQEKRETQQKIVELASELKKIELKKMALERENMSKESEKNYSTSENFEVKGGQIQEVVGDSAKESMPKGNEKGADVKEMGKENRGDSLAEPARVRAPVSYADALKTIHPKLPQVPEAHPVEAVIPAVTLAVNSNELEEEQKTVGRDASSEESLALSDSFDWKSAVGAGKATKKDDFLEKHQKGGLRDSFPRITEDTVVISLPGQRLLIETRTGETTVCLESDETGNSGLLAQDSEANNTSSCRINVLTGLPVCFNVPIKRPLNTIGIPVELLSEQAKKALDPLRCRCNQASDIGPIFRDGLRSSTVNRLMKNIEAANATDED
ncbi:unnamed protein product [Caenorhabditis auriculariae]|uniref:K Homology domain-containing protein n=1 Tax=Caenorhabditis auriculariae TaxID=2777116 RepID=A0A8S1H1K1_9PELO|nr:unnamed protein product [Caenorhabditis auriculariae]